MDSGYGRNRGRGSLLSVDELHAPRSEPSRNSEKPTARSPRNDPAPGNVQEAFNEPSRDQPRTLWSRLATRWRPVRESTPDQLAAKEEQSPPPDTDSGAAYRRVEKTHDDEGLKPRPIPRRGRLEIPQGPETREQVLWQPLIDPAAVFGEVWRSKRLIVGFALLGAVLGMMVALSTPRSYYAATDILIDPREWAVLDRDQSRGGLQADAALALIENQIRVMTSRPVLQETVERLGLAEDPEFNGRGSAGISPLSLVSNLRQLISFSGDGQGGDSRGAVAVNNLGRALFVSRGGRTFVVSVGVTTTDPEKSALIANALTDVYLDVSARLQAGSSGRAADELTARLDELRLGVEQAERAVETFKAENEIIDAQGRLITDDEITRLNDQLSQARGRTVELRARAQSARELDVQAVVNGSLPEQIASGSIVELRAQYTNLQLAADRLAVRLGPRHPELLSVTAQLRGAEQQIRTELSRIVASLQVDLSRAQQQEQELSAELARLKVRQGDLGNELVTLRELEREAAAKRAVYETFLLRARETGEQRQLNTANVAIISEAVPPLLPSGVSRAVISAGGLIFGLLLGIGFAGARGAWVGLRSPVPQRKLERSMSAERDPTPVHDLPPAQGRIPDDQQSRPGRPERVRHDTYPVGSYRRGQGGSHTNADGRRNDHQGNPEPWDGPDAESFDDIREGLRECREAIEQLTRQRADRSRYGT